MPKVKTSIYLIKQTIEQPQDCVDSEAAISKHDVPGLGVLYYKRSVERTPKWVSAYFPSLDDELKTSSASAVFVVPVDVADGSRLFAMTFGYGRAMLNTSCYVERFGLKTVLNTVGGSSLRKISRTTLAGNALKTSEQMPKRSSIDDFGIDIERDLLEGVTASLPDGSPLGSSATGSDSLSISVSDDVQKLPALLGDIYAQYATENYRNVFPWVDNINAVKSKGTIDGLRELVVRKIVEGSPDVWMAVPEVVDWEHVEGFRFSGRDSLHQDVLLEDFLRVLSAPLAEFRQLESKKVNMVGSDNGEILASWPASKCLYGEVEYEGNKYCINGGKWYQVENGFAARIEKSYAESSLSAYSFPVCQKGEKESDYNKALAGSGSGHFALMDAKNIRYGGGQSSIELCDVLTDQGSFIHVKKYAGSAPLSHLFNQGYVSTRLVKSDSEFREKASEVLRDSNPDFDLQLRDDSVKEVVFGVITKDDTARPRLPFFSKVTFDAVKSNLIAMGVKVSVKAIRLVEE